MIDFVDDVFTLDKEYVKLLCKNIIREHLNINWACTTRADLVDSELLNSMEKSGLWHISFGIESGLENIRNLIGKGIPNAVFRKVFDLCREMHIKTRAYGMLGHPTETIRDMEQTVEFIRSLRQDAFIIRLTDIIPGTRLFSQAFEDGLIDEFVWRDYIARKRPYPIYIPNGVRIEDIMRILNKINIIK